MPDIDAYFRFVDDGERETAIGILDEYAEKHGLTIVNHFCDKTDADAVCMEMLIGNARDGGLKRLLVPNYDALGSERLMMQANYYMLSAYGVRVISIAGGETADKYQKYLDSIKTYYTKGGPWSMRFGPLFDDKPRTVQGSLPYGYSIVGGRPRENPDESKLVAAAFEMYAQGMSASHIADKLTEACNNGKRFTRSGILSMIDNGRYCGLNRAGGERLPALVANSVWFAAKARREKSRSAESGRHGFILTGLDVCVLADGAEMRVVRPRDCCEVLGGRTMPLYMIKCGGFVKYAEADSLESAVLDRIREWLDEHADDYVRSLYNYARDAGHRAEVRAEECAGELKRMVGNVPDVRFSVSSELNSDIARFDHIKCRYNALVRLMSFAKLISGMCTLSREDIKAFFDRGRTVESLGTHEKRYFIRCFVKCLCLRPQTGAAALRLRDGTVMSIPIGFIKPKGTIVDKRNNAAR